MKTGLFLGRGLELTPLDRACISGNVKIVRALLAHPKTLSNWPSADGLTPF